MSVRQKQYSRPQVRLIDTYASVMDVVYKGSATGKDINTAKEQDEENDSSRYFLQGCKYSCWEDGISENKTDKSE